jgi:hypothetical protein
VVDKTHFISESARVECGVSVDFEVKEGVFWSKVSVSFVGFFVRDQFSKVVANGCAARDVYFREEADPL